MSGAGKHGWWVGIVLVAAAVAVIWMRDGAKSPSHGELPQSQSADVAPSHANGKWARWRGPTGNGVGPDADPPLTWSESQNLRWKTALPGPGSSSPVVKDGKLYIASYSGYGAYLDDGGDKSKLVHHLSCYEQDSGERPKPFTR